MLKPQDYVILIKLMAHYGQSFSQRQLSMELMISLAEINAGIKRLKEAGLLRLVNPSKEMIPIRTAIEELFFYGIKYLFPARLGGITRGIATAIGAPLFADLISLGDDPIPVWPDAEGDSKGIAMEPIHPVIPKALRAYPDSKFYEMLTLVDTLRQGRARERDLAKKLIKQKMSQYGNE